jgi:hypothetical protein
VNQIWDVEVLPNHVNGLEFEGTDLVSVGIGPLFLDPLCVQKGPPLPGMSPDVEFMAQRMGVTCPPLPFSTPDEFREFNKQIRDDPNVNAKWCEEKAREYLRIADGKTVFCKTASMMMNHYKHSWKGNQLIKRAQLGMGNHLKALSSELSGVQVENPPDIAAVGSNCLVSKKGSTALSLFVAPAVAPFQTSEIKTRPQLERLCAWSPACHCRAEECCGWTRKGCQVFGSDGEKDPPTLEDLQIARKKRDLVAVKSSTSSSKKQKQSENGEEDQNSRDCAWYPYCTLPVIVCGGSKRDRCCVYGGTNPIFSPPDMMSDFVKEARMLKVAAKSALYRERKRFARAASQAKAISPPYLLEPVTILGPMSTDRGALVLSFRVLRIC